MCGGVPTTSPLPATGVCSESVQAIFRQTRANEVKARAVTDLSVPA
jgi:hypothetical protein